MFQFRRFPAAHYGFMCSRCRSSAAGFPIQRSADHRIFAPTRGLSQLITSFFGSQCQGIHPTLFLFNLVVAGCAPARSGFTGPHRAPPLSLAATYSIDVSFFSSGYLDVSVHRVPLHTLWIYVWIHEVFSCGFPHSDISGS